MELSYLALSLLRHVVSFTGEKENNKDGEEVDCRRRLDVEESIARQTFFVSTNEKIKEVETKISELVKAHNGSIGKKELTQEEKDQAIAKFNEEYAELLKTTFSIPLTNKTKEFLKKYFETYGNDVGFIDGDGLSVLEISEKL